MAVKTPHRAKVVSLAAARERTRKHPRSRPEPRATAANVWKCGQCDEITEELLQFHPVFRHLAE
jgi:hypothetical protein